MAKKILIVVDMQNDFVTGTLANPMAEEIIPTIAEEMNTSDYVIFTRDTHFPDYLNTSEGRKLPVEHCIYETEGWNVVKQLTDKASELGINPRYVNKYTFGFTGWAFFDELYPKDAEIEIVGTCTEICVISNAIMLKSLYPEKEITVKSSACAGVTKEKHEAALDVMSSCQINIID